MEGSIIWWPLEGSIAWWPLKGSIAWWPLKGSIAWWPMEGEGETPFHFFPLSSQQILFKPSIFFPLTLRSYFTTVLGCYLCIFSLTYKLRLCILM
jgi:hypothetical protein